MSRPKKSRVPRNTFGISLPIAMHEQLKALAEAEDRAVSREVVRAVREYLQRRGVQVAESSSETEEEGAESPSSRKKKKGEAKADPQE